MRSFLLQKMRGFKNFDKELEKQFEEYQKKRKWEGIESYSKVFFLLLIFRVPILGIQMIQGAKNVLSLLIFYSIWALFYEVCKAIAQTEKKKIQEGTTNKKSTLIQNIIIFCFLFHVNLIIFVIAFSESSFLLKNLTIGLAYALTQIITTFIVRDIFFSTIAQFVLILSTCFTLGLSGDTMEFLAIAAKLSIIFFCSVCLNYLYEKSERKAFSLKIKYKRLYLMHRRFFEIIPDPAIIYMNGKLCYQNECSKNGIFKITQNNFRRKSMYMISEDGKQLKEFIREMEESDEESKLQNICFNFKPGGPLHESQRVLMASFIKTNFYEDKIGVAILFKDITEKLAVEEIKRGERYKNVLLCSLSHELRTPLNGILGMLSILEKQHKGAMNPYIKGALNSSYFLAIKIDDILDYAQILSSDFKLHLKTISLSRLKERMRTMFELDLQNKPIDFQIRQDPKLSEYFEADDERIYQALVNLIGNSVKYTEKGFIRLGLLLKGNQLEFEVSDSGMGMTKDQIDNLFRLHPKEEQIKELKTHKKASGLAGLGLTVTQMICSAMGDSLAIESIPGQSTSFSFSIPYEKARTNRKLSASSKSVRRVPLHQGQSVELRKRKSRSLRRLRLSKTQAEEEWVVAEEKEQDSKLTHMTPSRFVYQNPFDKDPLLVLIVDDNTMNRFVLRSLLGKYKVQIMEAENGLQAVNFVQDKIRNKETKLLIMMDIEMPVMDGINATIQIRKIPTPFPPVIIAVTAYASENERDKCLPIMDGFLTKPLTEQKIAASLQLVKK